MIDTIIYKLKQIFLYAGCKNEEEFQSIMAEIHKKNYSILKPMSLIITLFMIILYLLAIKSIILEYSIHIYSIYAFLFGTCYILICTKPENYNANSFSIMYLFIFVLYSFGIVNGIVIGYDKQAVSLISMLMLIPILFIDRPIRMHSVGALSIISFIYLELPVKKGEILSIDITNVIIFGLISMLLSYHVIKTHLQCFLTKNEMKQMSEYDILTGLKNRNAFEENLIYYNEKTKDNIACIYVDVNELRKINNTVNHVAGDEMLKFIASVMTDIFGFDDVYRIGGDEYVVFALNVDFKEMEEKIQRLYDITKKRNCSVSAGIEIQSSPHVHIKSLIIEAENKMYEAKREYYLNTGLDKRRKKHLSIEG